MNRFNITDSTLLQILKTSLPLNYRAVLFITNMARYCTAYRSVSGIPSREHTLKILSRVLL
jgi:hypothetical protein